LRTIEEKQMKSEQLEELVLQSLEHEQGGVKVYEMAVQSAVEAELKQEWEKYLSQTRTHVSTLEGVCNALEIDPHRETPGRAVVRHVGAALVEAMKMARSAGDPAAALLVACESVVLAETKDHLDWELLTKCADELTGDRAAMVASACEEVEDQEDEHLYHTKGWCRELWMQALGLNAVLPPPEEQRHVKTAVGAARAEQAAEKLRH
jgi:rubrerythrin